MAPTLPNADAPCPNLSLAKTLAPEDVRVGDYVALLTEAYEYPSFWWNCDASLVDRERPVRVEYVARDSGVPLRVESVCLPFVLVKPPKRDAYPLDLRCCRLVRLDRAYADRAWKLFAPKKSKQKRRKKSR